MEFNVLPDLEPNLFLDLVLEIITEWLGHRNWSIEIGPCEEESCKDFEAMLIKSNDFIDSTFHNDPIQAIIDVVKIVDTYKKEIDNYDYNS